MNETPWVCPITALPMNGVNVFLVNWTCGCVFSEKAHHELKASSCYGCGGTMETVKFVTLYPGEELLQLYEQRVAEDLAQRKQKKDEKNEKKRKSVAGEKEADQSKKKKMGEKQYDSIQQNPNVPKAVKSMFTTSEEAKRQPTAHWITHNPLYY